MEMHERLRHAREQAGFESASAAADRFRWTESTYRAHENGNRGIPKRKAEIYARAFRVSVEWLILGRGEDRKKPVALVGYVGAAMQIFPFDDGGSLEDIDPPPGVGPDAVAVCVKGDSMFPRYSEGDVLIYDEHLPLARVDGRECVVKVRSGPTLVKLVRLQPDQRITLESWNAPPMRDLELEWAAPVKWVQRA